VLGWPLGFFIGVICGLSVVLLIRTATTSRVTLKATLAEISQLLAIPTFCFAGPWLTKGWLSQDAFDRALSPYAISLALSFALIAGYPLFMLIVDTCHGITGPTTGPRS